MKRLFKKIQEIFSIEELKNKIVLTVLFLLVYRLGSFIRLPGVNGDKLTEAASGSLAGLINTFSGGAFSNASIFALGIMPYISASIVIQLMTMAVPSFQKMQKEGESGRKKINTYTRVLTVVITLFQSVFYLQTQIPADAIFADFTANSVLPFVVLNTIVLVAGTIFVMWLGEKITDRGIGNGISLLIMIGIIAKLPMSLVSEIDKKVISGVDGNVLMFLIEMVVFFFIVLVTVLLIQGVRRVPLQFAKQMMSGSAHMTGPTEGARQYIPLKVNVAGVMPIIFAQAIMFVPGMLANTEWGGSIFASFVDPTSLAYNVTTALMIVIFTFFYTAMVVNPRQMAEDFKKQGAFIPGVKPGQDTADYIDNIMSKITFPGAIFLAIIAIIPAFAMMAGIDTQFSYFFGGTSLLIMVGVILDTFQQIESHLLMRHYDGLMKSGKVRGRTGGVPASTSGLAG